MLHEKLHRKKDVFLVLETGLCHLPCVLYMYLDFVCHGWSLLSNVRICTSKYVCRVHVTAILIGK